MEKKVIETFEEYENLKLKAKEIDERIKELAPFIISNVPVDKEIQGKMGYFSVQKRAKWKYSASVKSQEESLKEAKKEEQAKGLADVIYEPTLYYRTEKQE